MDQWKLDRDPSKEDAKFLDDQLEEFNKQATGKYDFEPLQLVYRDDQDEIVAGVRGVTGWDWLYIATLWVREDLRGQHLGSNLLKEAETIARQRGCEYSCLTTYTFQAPRFYERKGYLVYGVLEDYPQGHQMIFLKKRLPRL